MANANTGQDGFVSSLNIVSQEWFTESNNNRSVQELITALIRLGKQNVPVTSETDAATQRGRYCEELHGIVDEAKRLAERTDKKAVEPLRVTGDLLEGLDCSETEAAAALLSLTAVGGLATLQVAIESELNASPRRFREAIDSAVESAAQAQYQATFESAGEGLDILNESMGHLHAARRLRLELESLKYPAYANIENFERQFRMAIESVDSEALRTMEETLESTGETEWTLADLLTPTPDEFEVLLGNLWQELDETAEVTATRRSSDGGVDVVASVTGKGVIIIQAKQYARGNKVGRPAVQKTKGALSQFSAHHAYVVTTSAFTDPAKRAASSFDDLDLIAGAKLINLLNKSDIVSPRAVKPSTDI